MKLVNIFDQLYSSIENRNKLLTKVKFYALLRFTIRLIINLIVPGLYYLTRNRNKNFLNKPTNSKVKTIVSLTTYPGRIKKIWITIESLLRQEFKPDKIILWLSDLQFKSVEELPVKLRKLQKRGLEIKFRSDDLKSHKKYYYAFKEYPNDIVITVDDDVIYNTKILTYLMDEHINNPEAIICNHGAIIKSINNELLPYIQWENVKCRIKPSFDILPIGVGGVLYPPNSLHKEVFNINVFKKYCMYADDIWLNIMTRLKGSPVLKTSYNSEYLPIMHNNNTPLHSININKRHNDIQIKKLRKYYKESLLVDPFEAKLFQ